MGKPQDFKKNDPRINLKGRPKGSKSFTTKVREALEVLSGVKDEEGVELTNEQLLAKNIVKDALTGKDTQLRKMVWNYLDGMPKQAMDLTSKGDKITGINYILPDGADDKTDNQTTSMLPSS